MEVPSAPALPAFRNSPPGEFPDSSGGGGQRLRQTARPRRPGIRPARWPGYFYLCCSRYLLLSLLLYLCSNVKTSFSKIVRLRRERAGVSRRAQTGPFPRNKKLPRADRLPLCLRSGETHSRLKRQPVDTFTHSVNLYMFSADSVPWGEGRVKIFVEFLLQ